MSSSHERRETPSSAWRNRLATLAVTASLSKVHETYDEDAATRGMIKLGVLFKTTVAAGVVGLLTTAVIAEAGQKGVEITVPAAAQALPWPNKTERVFMVPEAEVDKVDCGPVKTFLSSLALPRWIYDPKLDTQPLITTPSHYIGHYQMQSSHHTAPNHQVITEIQAHETGYLVAYCEYAPRVRHLAAQ